MVSWDPVKIMVGYPNVCLSFQTLSVSRLASSAKLLVVSAISLPLEPRARACSPSKQAGYCSLLSGGR